MAVRRIRQAVFVPSAAAIVAERRGFFAARGLEVETMSVSSSHAQRADLKGSRVDVGVTAIDNLFVWNAEGDDLVVIGQMESSTDLALLLRPGLAGLTELDTVRLAVDAPANGFAVVAYTMMRRLGRMPSNYEVIEVGGVVERFDALAKGAVDATLVAPPLDEIGGQQGMGVAMRVSQIDPFYPGLGVVARRTTLDASLKEVSDYLAALGQAIAWMSSAAADAVTAELATAGFGAAAIRSVLATLPDTLAPSREGIDALMTLRAGVDMAVAHASAPADMVDLWPLRAAGLAVPGGGVDHA